MRRHVCMYALRLIDFALRTMVSINHQLVKWDRRSCFQRVRPIAMESTM